jgi:hypothetical protein
MTQQAEQPAVGGNDAPELTPEERLDAAFGDVQDEPAEDEPAPVEGEEPEAVAEDEIELEEEADDLPPIEAPVSWDAEAKERFAKLPREDQEYLSKREGERDRFVQTKAQEAATAKREVEQAALTQLAQIERGYAEHYQRIAQQFDVAEPDMSLIATDPVTYAMQARQYQAAQAQRQQAQQTAAQYAQQAQDREAQAEQAHHAEQRQALVTNFPEYLDPTTGPKIQQDLSAVARDMGFPPELIAQARAVDILAMRTAGEWKAKADRLDRLEAKKMEKVRAAKGMPKIAKPGSAQAPGAVKHAQYATDREALRSGDNAATQRVLDSYFVKPK